MSEKLRSAPISIRLNEKEAPKEIQVLRTGNFNHPYYGLFTIDHEFLAQMVSNFELNVRGVDLMIDYNHDCEEAAAWVKGLSVKNGGNELWAEVEWTEQGKADVESKKYRYVSADFDEKYMDAETNHNYGPTLLGAALTNRPFVKNMAPAVELSENTTEGEEEMKTELEKLKDENKRLTEELGSLKSENKTLSEKGATLEKSEKETKELKEEIEKLKEENESLKKEKELSDKKAQFGKLLSEGKAVKAQEEAFLAGDTVKFAELAGATNLKAQGTGENPTEEVDGDAEDQVIELAEKLVKEGRAKDLGEAQSIVLNENPELRKKLYA